MISKIRWWLAWRLMTREQKNRVILGAQMLEQETQLRRIISLVSFDIDGDEIIQ